MNPSNLIDGRAIAEQIHVETAQRVSALKARGVQPGLVFVRVGEDPASKVYVGMKGKTSARLGLWSDTKVLDEKTSEADLLKTIRELNADKKVHGILVQAPLPKHIRQEIIYSSVAPEKDVDGFNTINLGKVAQEDESGFVACTPASVNASGNVLLLYQASQWSM